MVHMRVWNKEIKPVMEESDSDNEIIIEPEDFKIVPERTDPHWQPWEDDAKLNESED